MRCLGWVVAFDHLGADMFTADEFLLGAQQVREPPVEIPDLVQQLDFGIGVETQVADQLSDVSPVLLFDMGSVVL